jgi:hypothetical protein
MTQTHRPLKGHMIGSPDASASDCILDAPIYIIVLSDISPTVCVFPVLQGSVPCPELSG